MIRLLLGLSLGLLAVPGSAQERVAGTNSYILNEERFHFAMGLYWRQDNAGTFRISQGPLEDGLVNCVGAGFGMPSGVRGEGICIFETEGGSFTWAWQANPGNPNTWQVIDATGKWTGMRGEGTAISRIQSEFAALQHRVTDWQGEITLPK